MSRAARSRRTPLVGAAALALALLPALLVLPWQPTAAADGRPAVIGTRVIGHSVQGRQIVAWHLGEPGKKKVVLISLMHGNEPAPRRILTNLRRRRHRCTTSNLWVVPVYNPDGLAHHTRKNAHGVDPNRNYPYKWARLTGNYDSGPKPGLRARDAGDDAVPGEGASRRTCCPSTSRCTASTSPQRPKFSRRVARALGLPMTQLNCGSSCHGTMTMWFNHAFPGFALTVEYGAAPSAAKLRAAPDQILHLFGAWRGGVARDVPALTPGVVIPARSRCRAAVAPGTSQPRIALSRQSPSAPRRPASPWPGTASTAAAWSAVAPVRVIWADSNASASTKVWPAAYASDCRIAPSATVGPAASRAARSPTTSASSPAGTTCVASPRASASSACDRAREVEQLDRLGPPDQPLEGEARAGVARERDVGEGEVEAGRVGHDPQVAGEGQARARAGGHAVDRGDHRLGHPDERGHDRVVVLVDGAEQRVACDSL